jgi:hypothetical protein
MHTPRFNVSATFSMQSRRRFLMWCHVIVGGITYFVYLSNVDFTHFQWWRAGAGPLLLIIGVPVFVPFLGSSIHIWQLYTWQMEGPSPVRIATFAVVLVAGAVLVSAARLGAFGSLEGGEFLGFIVVQTFAYLWAGAWLLDVV